MERLFRLFAIVCIAVIFFSCSKDEKGAPGSRSGYAPSFVLPDFKNNRISLDDYKNKVVMLEFFASWCPPCKLSAAGVEPIYEKYRDRGFAVIAISLDKGSDAAADVEAFVRELGITYPALMDDGRTSRKYGVVSIPTSFIIDRQGKLRSRHDGLTADFREALSREIEALL